MLKSKTLHKISLLIYYSSSSTKKLFCKIRGYFPQLICPTSFSQFGIPLVPAVISANTIIEVAYEWLFWQVFSFHKLTYKFNVATFGKPRPRERVDSAEVAIRYLVWVSDKKGNYGKLVILNLSNLATYNRRQRQVAIGSRKLFGFQNTEALLEYVLSQFGENNPLFIILKVQQPLIFYYNLEHSWEIYKFLYVFFKCEVGLFS